MNTFSTFSKHVLNFNFAKPVSSENTITSSIFLGFFPDLSCFFSFLCSWFLLFVTFDINILNYCLLSPIPFSCPFFMSLRKQILAAPLFCCFTDLHLYFKFLDELKYHSVFSFSAQLFLPCLQDYTQIICLKYKIQPLQRIYEGKTYVLNMMTSFILIQHKLLYSD